MIASTVLDHAAETLGAYLPRLGAFLALLLIGYLVAAIVGRIVAKTLERVGLDALSQRVRIAQELTSVGIERPLSRLIGTAIRVAIIVISTVAAISALGLGALNSSLNSAVLLIPKLLIALLLLLAGIVAGRHARERVERHATRMDLVGPLGVITQAAIVAVFTTTALAELSVSLVILTVIVAIVIAAVCFAVALAFGLGSRDTARQITAGRTLASSLAVGQTISIGGHHGTIEAFEPAAIRLRTADGLLRIPNSFLLEGITSIHQDDS